MIDAPKATVAIPTLNRAGYLRIALGSALAQTYPNLEVIVSDNASSDHTPTLLAQTADPRLCVLRQTNVISMFENWNACLEAASGKYFLLLSDDDVLEPKAIEWMVTAFEESERRGRPVAFVYCRGKMIDAHGSTLSISPKAQPLESSEELILGFLDGRRSLWPCTVIFRREDLSPGYDTGFPLAADAVQCIRALSVYGQARFLNTKLAQYRTHYNTTATTHVSIWRNENNALGEFVIRQMKASGHFAAAVRTAVRRLNTRITSELINQSLRYKKRQALAAYWTERTVFLGWYGAMILAKGIALMMLPDAFRAAVRRMLYS